MYLQMLNDDELLRYAEGVDNALTTSDLERELTTRLRGLLDQSDDHAAVDAVLGEHDIDDAEELAEIIQTAVTLEDIAEEAGDAFQRLSELAKQVNAA